MPEALFTPSDVGVNQSGLVETIVNVIGGFPETVRPHFYKNIVLAGGSTRFPGFRTRLLNELVQSAPSHYNVNVTLPEKSVT